MKRILTIAIAVGAMAGFAAVDDTLITFSTQGPDKYADGTTVKDGECYALVWTKTGAAFAGIAADGTAVGGDSEVLVFAPLAKGGRCPATLFELDAELAKSYAGGTFGVYLVDTRLANGKLGGVNAEGIPVAVNGWGATGGNVAGGGVSGTPQVAVTTKSAVPEGTPKPTITAIRVVGDQVLLTVKNTVPYLQYSASEVAMGDGAAVQGSAAVQDAAAVQGSAADGEITIIVPRKGDRGLYSVGRE